MKRGCTVIKRLEPGTRVEPGESLIIPATFKAGRKQGEKSATITLVGEGDSPFTFEASAVVRTTYALDPALLNFGQVDPDGDAEHTATVTYQSATDALVSVEFADPDVRWLEQRIEELTAPVTAIRDESLLPRLRKLPTRAQRERAEQRDRQRKERRQARADAPASQPAVP